MTYRKLSTMNTNNDYSKDPYNLYSYFVENFIPINPTAKSNMSITQNRFNSEPNRIEQEHIQSQQINQMIHHQQEQHQQEIEDPNN